jgi:hypothetical protein
VLGWKRDDLLQAGCIEVQHIPSDLLLNFEQ